MFFLPLHFSVHLPLLKAPAEGALAHPTHGWRQWCAVAFLTLIATCVALPPVHAAPAAAPAATRTLNDWLMRIHEATRQRSFMGTLVVSAGDSMSASRIWHVCDGAQQLERIDTLTGSPRSTLRRNSDVITFSPETKTALVEKRDSLGLFPDLLQTPSNAIPTFYGVREKGIERVAGHMADVVEIYPKDSWRFGYRIWSEQKTGLVVKLQTLGEHAVLEQTAFSELQLDAPVSMDKLNRQMNDTKGYELHRSVLRKTTPEAEGWRLKEAVPGFTPMSCHTRETAEAKAAGPAPMQWVFSDGLASVSLFVEPFDEKRHGVEKSAASGATHSVTRRLGSHWLTVMGEVPPATLRRFAQSLERTR